MYEAKASKCEKCRFGNRLRGQNHLKMNTPAVQANAGHCTGERYEELFERISEHSGSESGRQQFAERFVGRQSWLFGRNEVASESISPISTSATIRPPMGPRR
jgi:hypothetical protein